MFVEMIGEDDVGSRRKGSGDGGGEFEAKGDGLCGWRNEGGVFEDVYMNGLVPVAFSSWSNK